MGIFDDIGDFIFGEAPDTDIQREGLHTPEQSELLRDLINRLQGGNVSVGGMNPSAMNSSLTALENWSNQIFSGGDALTSGEGQAGVNAIKGAMDRGPSDFSDYFKETVEKPLFETFGEDIMPGISRGYAPSGFWSSQRVESQNRAREDLIDALTKERSATGYQTYQDDLTRKLQGGNILANLGLQSQGLAGENLFQMGMFQANEPQRRKEQEFSLMLQALGVRPFENIATVSGGQTGLIPGMAGGIGQGVGSMLGYNLLNRNTGVGQPIPMDRTSSRRYSPRYGYYGG